MRHLLVFLFLLLSASVLSWAQQMPPAQQSPELQPQLTTAPPPVRVAPPSPTATAEELEQQADELRDRKSFPDALDYYHEAIKRNRKKSAVLYNKIGIVELQMQRFKDARKDFGRAIKIDKTYPEAYNNLGATYYQQRKYGKAVKEYRKAIALREESASFHSNLGTAYFSQKKFQLAGIEYARALQLDPEIFDRISKGGVAAHLQSPEDRAHFSYIIAKMYAQIGNFDRSLLYLRRAMEDGYEGINDVYKDPQFTKLREDPRFTALMETKPVAIPQS